MLRYTAPTAQHHSMNVDISTLVAIIGFADKPRECQCKAGSKLSSVDCSKGNTLQYLHSNHPGARMSPSYSSLNLEYNTAGEADNLGLLLLCEVKLTETVSIVSK